jgi:hypothetical protein
MFITPVRPLRYVEPLSDGRTKLGKGRVLARLGMGGCNKAFFNILLGIAWDFQPETLPQS